MREWVEQALGCKALKRYGSREVGAIAAQEGTGQDLRLGSMVQVGTLSPDERPCDQGETGGIVVTSLVNPAMPLIGYRTGDVGVLKSYNGQPGLEKVVGRTVGLFRTKDGRAIDGEYAIHLLYFRDWVRDLRSGQVEVDRVAIETVLPLDSEPLPVKLWELERNVKRVMGEDGRIDWTFADEIQPLPSGKCVYTLSEVK